MKTYPQGILVRVIQAGKSSSGVTYPEQALAMQEVQSDFRGPIACHLGHQPQAPYVGRFLEMQYHGGALWGQLLHANVKHLVQMHEGALAAGRPGLGISIKARAILTESRTVKRIDVLESIDVDTRTEAAQAGGLVPFWANGQPVAWEQRHLYWDGIGEAATTAATPTRRMTEVTAQPSLEEIGEKIRAMLNPVNSGGIARPEKYMWVRATYVDRVIVDMDGTLAEVSYKVEADGSITLGQPAEVRIVYQRVDAGAVTEAVHHPASNVVPIHESACGRLLGLIA